MEKGDVISNRAAQTFAVQTAVMALLVDLLVERRALDRADVVNGLYDLLQAQVDEGISDGRNGPIRHLISLVELD